MSIPETRQLASVLQEFKSRFNSNPRARKLTINWNRLVLLDSSNTGSKYGLLVKDSELVDVLEVNHYDEDAEDLVHLQAEEDILSEIFSGQYNPATALTDGNLAVFSKERDKVKLEALAMVIWRLG